MRVLFFLSCFFLCLLRGVCGSGFFDEDAAESALISETTLAVSPMFASAPVRSALVGGYFSAALFHNGTIAIQVQTKKKTRFSCVFLCFFHSSFQIVKGHGSDENSGGCVERGCCWHVRAAGTGLGAPSALSQPSRPARPPAQSRRRKVRTQNSVENVCFFFFSFVEKFPLFFVKSGDGHVAAFCSGFEGFRVVLSSAPSALVCGSNFALALYDDGRVMGLGSDSWGALAGTGSSENSWTELLRGASSVAAGGDHALAVVDGKVLSWGWAEMGQLGR